MHGPSQNTEQQCRHQLPTVSSGTLGPVAVLRWSQGAQSPKSCPAPKFFQSNLGLTFPPHV